MTEPESDYRYAIESVDNAARILLMLRDRSWIRTSDVARELGVARSTAHRMVSTLLHRGLLRQNPGDRSYGPGFRLVELGMSVIGMSDLRGQAMPFLGRLAADTGETAHLIVLDGDEILFVAAVEGGHVIRAASRVGARVPAHATGAGKCLLAALTPEELDRLYPDEQLTPKTDATIRSRAQLLSVLEQVRTDGIAVNAGESETGLMALSAPLLDHHGRAHGAISLSGPIDRVAAERDRYSAALLQATTELTAAAFG